MSEKNEAADGAKAAGVASEKPVFKGEAATGESIFKDKKEKRAGTVLGEMAAENARPRPVQKWHIYIFLLIIGLVAGGVGGALVSHFLPTATNTKETTSVIESEGDVIQQAAAKIGPSVVSIVTTSQSQSSGSSLFDYYFGGGSDNDSQTTQAAGTGIIVSKDGYVLTNNHVVSGATKVTVYLQDGTEYDNASVVSTDATSDIAFVKIPNVSNLTPAEIGSSSSLKLGTKVIAVGNALGEFQNTVTSGIISGMNRSITASDEDGSGSENLTGLIQTDAAINSGNSGGPLITYDGKVVGMNTAVASSANNIGFAIPIDSISSSIASVTKGGKINKAYLGVYYTTITPALAKSKNLAVSNGAYVGGDNTNATVSGSPADKAGIKSGDIITKIGDTTLDTSNTLSVVIGKHAAGDKVTLTILRDGKTMTVDVTLGSAADVNSKN